MLARAVDAFEGLFVQQDTETVLAADFTHQCHDQQVVVVGEVAFLEDRGQLELVRGHFVMTGFQWDTQFEGLHFQLFHKFHDAGGDGTEVMVLELLVFAALMAHQRTSAEQQVGAGGVESFVYQEIFLLPTEVGIYFLYLRVEVMAYVDGSLVYGFERFQQWGFIVEGFAGVGDEDGRDTQGVTHDKSRRGRVPGGVTAGFERITDTAVREAGGIGFLLYEQFAGKLFDHAAFAVVFDESVMFFGCPFGEGVEPVGIMCCTHFDGPFLHTGGYGVGSFAVEGGTVVDGVDQSGIGFFRKILEHLLAVEYVLSEIFRRTFCRGGYFGGSFLEGRFYYSES